VPSLVEIGSVVLEIFEWPHSIFTFLWLALLRRGPSPLFEKKNFHSLHSKIICIKFDWIWPAGSGEEDLLKLRVYFYSFDFICPWRGTNPFVWTNLNPLPPRMICSKSTKIWPVVLEKKISN
jgi:hypothetical protein